MATNRRLAGRAGANNTEPVTAFGKRMRAARIAANRSLGEVMQEVAIRVGAPAGTYEYLRKLELNEDGEDRIDLVLLVVLADIYNVPVAKLSPRRNDDVERVARLFERRK